MGGAAAGVLELHAVNSAAPIQAMMMRINNFLDNIVPPGFGMSSSCYSGFSLRCWRSSTARHSPPPE
jgi:hypothetical protein